MHRGGSLFESILRWPKFNLMTDRKLKRFNLAHELRRLIVWVNTEAARSEHRQKLRRLKFSLTTDRKLKRFNWSIWPMDWHGLRRLIVRVNTEAAQLQCQYSVKSKLRRFSVANELRRLNLNTVTLAARNWHGSLINWDGPVRTHEGQRIDADQFDWI